MEKLSTKKRLNIVKQYLSGQAYDEIASKSGVSKGTVANVVTDLKSGRFPEVGDVVEHIDLLRELSFDLKRSQLTAGQCAIGLAVINRINECGLDPADIERWPLILKSIEGEDTVREFIAMVYAIQDVQKRTGLSLEGLHNKVLDLEKKAAELEPVLKKVAEQKQAVAALVKRRDELTPVVNSLEQKHTMLNSLVSDLQKRQSTLLKQVKEEEAITAATQATLATWNKASERLAKIGFTLEALTEFNDRAKTIAARHHVAVSALRDRLLHELEILGKSVGLEKLIESRQAELKKLKQIIAEAQRESRSLVTVIENLKQEKTDLEADIKETRGKVGAEMAKIVASARTTINTLGLELKQGHNEALKEVRRLKEEAIELGREVGRYQEILEANPWLSDLLSLAQGEEDIEGKRVRAMSLLVLRGAAVWLKHNKTDNLELTKLFYAIENLTREVEQWKA